MKANEFIKDCTKTCSNESDWKVQQDNMRINYYRPWVTPEQALRAVELAKKEAIQELLKDSIEATVMVDAGGYPYISKNIELYDYDNDTPLAKEGDKVAIVIVKQKS